MKKVLCYECRFQISAGNYKKHCRACNGAGPFRARVTKSEYSETLCCKYCTKQLLTANSHRNHERCCPSNPDRNYVNGMLGKTSHKKGRTKDTDESIMRASHTLKNKILSGEYVPRRWQHTAECKERISAIMQHKMKNRYTASKRIEYNGVRFESSWEYAVAVDLDMNGVSWERPSPLIYTDCFDQKRRYYPDFYLPVFNVYLDPKNNYVKKLDAVKIELVQKQNGVKIILLNKEQLHWAAIQELIF